MSGNRIRAAGGVVLRDWHDGTQVLLIHRPEYDDWSHPKGKCDDGEKYVDTAVREVHEETGIHPSLGPRLTNVTYPVGGGRHKKVKFWVMYPDGGDGTITRQPDSEVDDLVWVSPKTALGLLTHEHDRLLLKEALEVTGR